MIVSLLLECSLFTTTRGFPSPLFLCRSANLKHYICIAFCGTFTCTFERLPEPLPINSQITWKIRKKITTITNTIPCSLLYRAQFFNIIALTVKLTHAVEHSQKVDELQDYRQNNNNHLLWKISPCFGSKKNKR